MTEEQYQARRRELALEVVELRSKRLHLTARARIRKIAELDYQFKGTPKEETLKRFNYDK